MCAPADHTADLLVTVPAGGDAASQRLALAHTQTLVKEHEVCMLS